MLNNGSIIKKNDILLFFNEMNRRGCIMNRLVIKLAAGIIFAFSLAACHQDDDHHYRHNDNNVSANCYHDGRNQVHCDANCHRNYRGEVVCDKN